MPWRNENLGGGFTLVEILVAILILGVTLSTIYVAYTGTFRIIQDVSTENEKLIAAQIFFSRIGDDLGRIVPYNGKYEFRCGLKEMGDKRLPILSFRSAHHLPMWDKDKAGGSSAIVYEVRQEKEGKLTVWRHDRLISKPLSFYQKIEGGFRVCTEVRNLTYLFFDSAGNEYKTWDSGSEQKNQKDKIPTVLDVKLELEGKDERGQPLLMRVKFYLPVSQVGK